MRGELTAVAVETLEILSRGAYTAPSGARVPISDAAAAAIAGSRIFLPDDLAAMEAGLDRNGPGVARPPAIEVTDERTGAAARRLAEAEGLARVLALSFANGTHVGGGFLRGARAQEEALCRCSALYRCLEACPGFYRFNAREDAELSTDAVVYSPDVPFFRDEELRLLERPFSVSVLTAAAPIAPCVARRPDAGALLPGTLRRRTRRILAVAAAQDHNALVLGAWGCGAFGNDPVVVADAFASALEHPGLAGAFEQVVFAVFDPAPPQRNLAAFRERFERR